MPTASPQNIEEQSPAASRNTLSLAGGLVLIAIVVWFLSLPRGIMMGDDLLAVYSAQHGGFLSDPLRALGQEGANRYRPILQLILALVIPIFGSNFLAYELLNLAVEILNAWLVFLIASRLSKNEIVAICATLIFAISRFSYYSVQQMFGLMEGLAIVFLLLIVYDALVASQAHDDHRFNRLILWFGLLLFTDERFLAIFPFVLLCGFFYFRDYSRIDWRRFRAFALAAVALVAVNIAAKVLIFHSLFLQGAADQPIGFAPGPIARQLWSGLLNTVGFNVGPDYLSARDVSEVGLWGYALGLLTVALIAVVVAAYAWKARATQDPNTLRNVFLAAILYFPLLLSASITFRQEFRWLYAPFTVLLISLAGMAGALRANQRAVNAVALALAAVSLYSTAYYRSFLSNVYFERSQIVANEVLDATARTDSRDVIMFFNMYGLGAVAIRFVDKLGPSDVTADAQFSPKILDVQGSRVTTVDPSTVALVTATGASYDFVQRFDKGTINSHAPVSTPNKRGAFVISWANGGLSAPTLTLLSGFRYSFHEVYVPHDSVLRFAAAKPLTVGASTRGLIEVTDGSRTYRIFQHDFPPSASESLIWEYFSVSLAPFANRRVTISFGADTLEGNAAGAWVAFARPAIANSVRK